MDEPEYDPIECPTEGCAYEDAIRSVAAHVSGTHDERHSWEQLEYRGARDFVMAEKRRQSRADASGAASEATTSDEAAARSENDSDARAESGADTMGEAGADAVNELDRSFVEDALVVAELVERYDTPLGELDPFRLVNLYALLSELKGSADAARVQVRDALLERVQDDREVASDFGTARRYSYTTSRLRDEETVTAALEGAGIDPESVRSLDAEKVEAAVEEADLDPEAVFEFEEGHRIRRTSADAERRRAAFEELRPQVRALLDRL